jgi:hypothetical protein
MGNDLQKGTIYATGGVGGQGTITSANLNAHVDDATIKATFISAKADRSPGTLTDSILLEASGTLYKMLLSTLQPLLNPPGAPFSVYPGAVIQTVSATPYTANANLSTLIPGDDTIPQITEGTEILTLNIAPRFNTSKVRLTFNGWGIGNSNTTIMIAALFRAGNANALKATLVLEPLANNYMELNLDWMDSPATTSTVTYSIRVGPHANIMRMNGSSTARLLGGSGACTLIAQEIKV